MFDLPRVRNGTLLGPQEEHIHAAFNPITPHRFVRHGVVMQRQIVPVDRKIVHEIEAERGAMARHFALNAVRGQHLLQTGPMLSECSYTSPLSRINFSIVAIAAAVGTRCPL